MARVLQDGGGWNRTGLPLITELQAEDARVNAVSPC